MKCQLDVLDKLRTAQDILDALKNLPKSLFETYDRILTSINAIGETESRIARSILTWVVGAVRPLKLEELAELITIVPGRFTLALELRVVPEDILDVCGSLLEINEKKEVTLSHFTVKVNYIALLIYVVLNIVQIIGIFVMSRFEEVTASAQSILPFEGENDQHTDPTFFDLPTS